MVILSQSFYSLMSIVIHSMPLFCIHFSHFGIFLSNGAYQHANDNTSHDNHVMKMAETVT